MGTPRHQMASKTILALFWKSISFLFQEAGGGVGGGGEGDEKGPQPAFLTNEA